MFVEEDCVDSRSDVDDLRTRDCIVVQWHFRNRTSISFLCQSQPPSQLSECRARN